MRVMAKRITWAQAGKIIRLCERQTRCTVTIKA
jgi:hypothetical protein